MHAWYIYIRCLYHVIDLTIEKFIAVPPIEVRVQLGCTELHPCPIGNLKYSRF